MSQSRTARRGIRLGAIVCVVILAACSSDAPIGPSAGGPFTLDAERVDRVSVCHFSESDVRVIAVGAPALDAHFRHGDHIAAMFVDAGSPLVGDGVHFNTIGGALAAARAERVARGEMEAAACRITIDVAPGVVRGSVNPSADPAIERLPLIIDFPSVTVRGALAMGLDADGRATGTADNEAVTTITPSPPLVFGGVGTVSEPIIVVNGHPTGFRGNDVTIEGFAFQSGHAGVDALIGGQGILALRVDGLVIRGNRFEPGFTESMDLRAANATVGQNHLAGGGGTCDMCLAGPGSYQAIGNRLLAGGIPGVLISPATLLPVPAGVEPYGLPASSLVTATVENNEVRDHLRKPVGVGVRIAAVGVGAPNVAGTARVLVRGNTLANNTFGIIAEAGFPLVNTALKGDIDLTLDGNTITRSCQRDFFISFSRHQTGLGLQNAPYLRNSSYAIALNGNVAWENVWFSHPTGTGNALIVDGELMQHGQRAAYDGPRICAAS